MPSFSVSDIPTLTGKVAIVTGANTGLGKVTALELARKGAHVVLACRSKDRTEPVAEEIKKITGNQQVEFVELDLGSLRSVQSFAKAFLQRNIPLNILVNNAGIMGLPKLELSKDGIEAQFATNHVGHYYLTRLLLPALVKGQPASVVSVSSAAHKFAPKGGIVFDKINDQKAYGSWSAYGQSKLANILFAKALQKHIDKDGESKIYVNAIHPGVVKTELTRYSLGETAQKFLSPIIGFFMTAPEDGALTQLYCATSTEIEAKNLRGQYFVPTAKLSSTSSYGADTELADRLWAFTEDLIKEKLGSDAFQL